MALDAPADEPTSYLAVTDRREHAGEVTSEVPGYPRENVRVMHADNDIVRFYDRCSDLMRELLTELAAHPDTPRTFPAIEDALDWPRRRIASVLGGVSRLRRREFEGRARITSSPRATHRRAAGRCGWMPSSLLPSMTPEPTNDAGRSRDARR